MIVFGGLRSCVPGRFGPPEGLFFCHRPRSHTTMDPDLENVIRQAFGDAEATSWGLIGSFPYTPIRVIVRARVVIRGQVGHETTRPLPRQTDIFRREDSYADLYQPDDLH